MATKETPKGILVRKSPNVLVYLGDKVEDKISKFEGIATSLTRWNYGCTRISVLPQGVKNGVPMERCVFDEPQLKVLERNVVQGRFRGNEVSWFPYTGGICIGDLVKHVISGMTGVVVAEAYYLFNEPMLVVQPDGKTESGTIAENLQFEIGSVKLLKKHYIECAFDLEDVSEKIEKPDNTNVAPKKPHGPKGRGDGFVSMR